jgi:predicted metal-dependent HD superfamily phosphohydrolase
LDCDLCILGQEEVKYKIYAQQIRAEYKNVPNFLYQSGRIEVLNKFLARERIFFTDLFFAQFEKQARENIKNELILLQ